MRPAQVEHRRGAPFSTAILDLSYLLRHRDYETPVEILRCSSPLNYRAYLRLAQVGFEPTSLHLGYNFLLIA